MPTSNRMLLLIIEAQKETIDNQVRFIKGEPQENKAHLNCVDEAINRLNGCRGSIRI